MTNDPANDAAATEPVSLEDRRAQVDAEMGGKWIPPANRASAPDDQTMPGFEDPVTPEVAAAAFPEVGSDAEVEAAGREFAALSHGPVMMQSRAEGPDGITRTAAFIDDDPEQGSYLPPDVPDGHHAPPLTEVFANATWLEAEAQFVKMVDEVMAFDEFSELRDFPRIVVWNRKGAPVHAWADLDGERLPRLAGVTILNEFARWIANKREDPLPTFAVNLYYIHFEKYRKEGFFYHGDIIKRDIHIALAGLMVTNGIVGTKPPALVLQSLKTLERYGLFSQSLRAMQKPMLPLMEQDIMRSPGFEPGATE